MILSYLPHLIGAAGLIATVVFYIIGYKRGFLRGKDVAKLAGGYCDICNQVAEKFVAFKMYVVCDRCFEAIKSNRDMKCRFCNEPVEKCSCV